MNTSRITKVAIDRLVIGANLETPFRQRLQVTDPAQIEAIVTLLTPGRRDACFISPESFPEDHIILYDGDLPHREARVLAGIMLCEGPDFFHLVHDGYLEHMNELLARAPLERQSVPDCI